MAEKNNRPHFQVLEHASQEFKLHESRIASLKKRAGDLFLLQGKFTRMFEQHRIICASKSNGDKSNDSPTVSSSLFALSRNIQRELDTKRGNITADETVESTLENLSNSKRNLILDVLGTQLSIQVQRQDPENAVDMSDALSDALYELEEYLFQNKLPSLLPNYSTPKSLSNELRSERWAHVKANELDALYVKLFDTFFVAHHYLNALAWNLVVEKKYNDVIKYIDKAAKDQLLSFEEMVRSNPLLFETAIIALYQTGQYKEVIHRCQFATMETFIIRPGLFENYVRSLLELQEIDVIITLLEEAKKSEHLLSATGKVRGIASEQICWLLYGKGEYARAIQILETHCKKDIDPKKGRENMQCLYETLKQHAEA